MDKTATGKDQSVSMSFWDHLDALRGVLIRSALAVLLCSAVGLCFKSFLFEDIILAPTKGSFCVWKLLGVDFEMSLINVEISAQFFAHLKAAFIAGIVVACPYIIWELWRFLRPALYKGEQKVIGWAFGGATLLFYLGVLVGYFFVLPVCLQFFLGYTVSEDVTNSITLSSYMSMFASMVLLIGLVFELPTLIVVLNRLGVLSLEKLRKGRRYALVAILVLSAAITPSDPVSMLVLAAPLYLLYELSIVLCLLQKKKEIS